MFNPNGNIEFPGGLADAENEVQQVKPDSGLSHGDPRDAGTRPKIAQRPEDPAVRARVDALRAAAKKAEEDEKLLRQQRAAEREERKPLTPEQRTQKMYTVMSQIAQRRYAKLPVGSDGRIGLSEYVNVPNYGESVYINDSTRAYHLEENFQDSENGAKKIKIGELMERICVALFDKFLPGLISVRASKFDDYLNKVDAVILLDGIAVAAFDMAAEDNFIGENKEKKQKKVDDENQNGGAIVKYAFSKKGDAVALGSETDLPIYALYCDSHMIHRAIDNFTDGPQNDGEKCMFYYLIDSLYRQIDKIEKNIEDSKREIEWEKEKAKARGKIFNPRFEYKDDYIRRVETLRKYLEDNLSREEVKDYLLKQLERSKGTRKMVHKRKITRLN